MTEPRFQPVPAALDIGAIVALTGARTVGGPARVAISGVALLDQAGPSDIAFLDDGRDDAARLGSTDAGACFVAPAAEARVPAGTVALVTDEPRRAFLAVASALFPSAARPSTLFGPGVATGAAVHPEARLEPDVSVDPGAVIGPGVEIGRGASIGANAVVGAGVRIGRDSAVGAGATVSNALIGDRVVIQPGVSIGHAGLGADARPRLPGLPAFGRVIVQDDAEIGANAAIARGARRDTILGEATRVEALARIGPDVVVGRHCLVHAAVSLVEGTTVGDYTICGLAREGGRPALEESDE